MRPGVTSWISNGASTGRAAEKNVPTPIAVSSTVEDRVSPTMAKHIQLTVRPAAKTVTSASFRPLPVHHRSEEHTSELQSLMRFSYAVFCLKNKKQNNQSTN